MLALAHTVPASHAALVRHAANSDGLQAVTSIAYKRGTYTSMASEARSSASSTIKGRNSSAMAQYAYSEYHDILRVDADTMVPYPGYEYMCATKRPLHVLQYARETTLARGRILYEVWDSIRYIFIGYIIPGSIFDEAINIDRAPSWSSLPAQTRAAHYKTQQLILDRFPRIPSYSARTITKILLHDNRHIIPSTHLLEAAVVDHAKHCWTSYDFRIQLQGQSPFAAAQSVKERMRDVLESWLPICTSTEKMLALWKRHELCEVGVEDEDREWHARTLMHCYGGAETVANLVSASAW